MFSRKEQLITRTGNNGIGRYDFLKLLITEFQTSKSRDSRKQVLANLANFAYDPINYQFLRDLRAIDLFLVVLSETDEILVRFAIGGICNLCLDTITKDYILANQGIALVSSLLSSTDRQTVLSAITTLMFLVTPASKNKISSTEIVKQILELSNSTDRRINNLANIFLADYCTTDQIEEIKRSGTTDSSSNISLRVIVEAFRSLVKAYCTKVTVTESTSKVNKGLKIGEKISIVRTVSDNDVRNFAKLTDDYNPVHFETPEKIVHGALLNGFLSGVLGTKLPGPGTLVVEQLIRYPKPCYTGDTIEISVEVLSTRKIINCRYSIVANSKSVVLEGEGKFVMSINFGSSK